MDCWIVVVFYCIVMVGIGYSNNKKDWGNVLIEKSIIIIDDNKGWFFWFLVMVEWLGNLLFYFVMLFVILIVFIVLLSGFLSWFGVFVVDLRLEDV